MSRHLEQITPLDPTTRVIWKARLLGAAFGSMEALIPNGAEILHVGLQLGEFHVWFMCSPAAAKEPRKFIVLPTGADFNCTILGRHLNTVVDQSTGLVFHFFEAA